MARYEILICGSVGRVIAHPETGAERPLTADERFMLAQAAELSAWRQRFPGYVYRPQDACVALQHEPEQGKGT